MPFKKLVGNHGLIREVLPFIKLLEQDVRVQKIRPEKKNNPDNLSVIDPDNSDLIYISTWSGNITICVVNLGDIAQIINITCLGDISDTVKAANSSLIQKLERKKTVFS